MSPNPSSEPHFDNNDFDNLDIAYVNLITSDHLVVGLGLYHLMRQSQGKSGNGNSTLRTWMSRGYIVLDEASGNYCKTEEYKQKYSKA